MKFDDTVASASVLNLHDQPTPQEIFLLGFNLSAEGYNGEYPFADKNRPPETDYTWCAARDRLLADALGTPVATPSVESTLRKLLSEAQTMLRHTRCIDDDALKCPACSLEAQIEEVLAKAK